MAIKPVSASVKSVAVTIGSSSSGTVKSDPVKLGKFAAIRSVEISSEEHNPDRLITVRAGTHKLLDAIEDLQAYSTPTIDDPEKAPRIDQDGEIVLEVYVPSGAAPATNKKYVAAIAFWEVLEVAD